MGIDDDAKQLGLNTIGNSKVYFVLQIADDKELEKKFFSKLSVIRDEMRKKGF